MMVPCGLKYIIIVQRQGLFIIPPCHQNENEHYCTNFCPRQKPSMMSFQKVGGDELVPYIQQYQNESLGMHDSQWIPTTISHECPWNMCKRDRQERLE